MPAYEAMNSSALLMGPLMPSYEFSLVIFTVLSQVSIGLSVVGLMFSRSICRYAQLDNMAPNMNTVDSEDGCPPLLPQHGRRLQCLWYCNVIIMAMALFASLFHLGQPWKAPMALNNLHGAWLSREILAFGLYFGLMLVTCCALFMKNRGRGYRRGGPSGQNESTNPPVRLSILFYDLGSMLTVAMGFTALIASSLAYAPPALAAIHNILPFIFFSITAVGLGSALGLVFMPKHGGEKPLESASVVHHKLYGRLMCICGGTLLVGLAIYLIIPCVWLSGGPILQSTGARWLGSPWYWGHLLFTFLWPLLLLWRLRYMPRWLPLIMVMGAFMGRMSFFADTISTALGMGYPY